MGKKIGMAILNIFGVLLMIAFFMWDGIVDEESRTRYTPIQQEQNQEYSKEESKVSKEEEFEEETNLDLDPVSALGAKYGVPAVNEGMPYQGWNYLPTDTPAMKKEKDNNLWMDLMEWAGDPESDREIWQGVPTDILMQYVHAGDVKAFAYYRHEYISALAPLDESTLTILMLADEFGIEYEDAISLYHQTLDNGKATNIQEYATLMGQYIAEWDVNNPLPISMSRSYAEYMELIELYGYDINIDPYA